MRAPWCRVDCYGASQRRPRLYAAHSSTVIPASKGLCCPSGVPRGCAGYVVLSDLRTEFEAFKVPRNPDALAGDTVVPTRRHEKKDSAGTKKPARGGLLRDPIRPLWRSACLAMGDVRALGLRICFGHIRATLGLAEILVASEQTPILGKLRPVYV